MIVQEVFGGIEPLLRVTVVPPETALTDPPHEFVRLTGFARKTLVGRLSVRDTPVSVLPSSLFLITMESSLVSPAHIVVGLKFLVTEGVGFPVTFKVALAGVVLLMVVPPPVEDNSPAGIVLIRFPGVEDVTLTETVQRPGVVPTWGGTVPPLRARVVPPATAVTVPPQEFVTPAGLAIVRPGWTPTKLSVHAALVRANPLGLKTVTLNRDVPPAAIEIGEKLLFISAGRDI